MKKANFLGHHQSLSYLNQGSYRSSVIKRRDESMSGFLKEKGELRLAPFSIEEEERMANPRPRTQTERILTLCSERGLGLREAIAESRRVYSC